MSVTSLAYNNLTLEDEVFTSSDLEALTDSSKIFIVGIRSGSTYTIPTSYRSYTFVVFQGGKITTIQPNSSYQVQVSADSVLVGVTGVELRNYGHKSTVLSGIASSPSISLDFPTDSYSGVASSPSVSLDFPTDSYSGVASSPSVSLDFPVDSYSGVASSPSVAIDFPTESYSGVAGSPSVSLEFPVDSYSGVATSPSITVEEIDQ